jgi:Ca2+-binding RTX toxin-like protein
MTTAAQQTQVLQITLAMFGASPGATYLQLLEDMLAVDSSMANLAQNLSGTALFFDHSYSDSLTPAEFADVFIDDLVDSSVSSADKAWATSYIVAKMAGGATQASIIAELTQALSSIPPDDANWGAAATNYNTGIVTKIVDNLVGSSVSDADKSDIVDFIVGQMAAGQNFGAMVEWAVTTLDGVSHTNAIWGDAAAFFDNRIEVSRYYSIDQGRAAIDLATLQLVLADVTSDADSVITAKSMIDELPAAYSVSGVTVTLLEPGALDITSATDLGSVTALVFNSGGNTITMTDTQQAAFTAITGGAGTDAINVDATSTSGTKTINLTTSVLTNMTVGTDKFVVNAAAISGTGTGYTIATSALGDTVALTNGANTVTGGAGADTITGGTGADVITGGGGADTLTGGSGNDTFKFATAAQLAAATVAGGANTDTIEITGSGVTLADAGFDAVTGVEALTLGAGATSTTLGANADSAGIVSLETGTGATTIASANALAVDATSLEDGALLTTSGAGAFTVTDLKGNLTDSSTAAISVTLADVTTITLELGTDETGTDEVIADALTNGDELTMTGDNDATVSLAGGDLIASEYVGTLDITTTGGTSSIRTGTADTSITGTGTTEIDATALADDALLTTSGAATYTVTGLQGDLTNSSTAAISVTLVDVATATLALGANTNGTDEIIATSLTDGDVLTMTGSNDATVSLTGGDLAASAYAGALTVTVTSTTIASSIVGGTGDDIFKFVDAGASLTTADTVNGTSGTDTIYITAADTTIVDANFTNVSNIGKLKLTGISSATLGTEAVTNGGIARVVTGTGATTITTANAVALTIDATLIADGTTLTTAGDGALTVTGLQGNLSNNNSNTGNLTVTTVAVADLTVAFGTNTTGTHTLNANALTNGQVVTLTGSDDATVSLIDGDLTASGYLVGSLTVTADSGSNIITTGTGDDTITGGGDADTLTGGTGIDTFIIAATDSLNTALDTISDYTAGTDILDLEVATTSLAASVGADLSIAVSVASTGTTSGTLATDIATAVAAQIVIDANFWANVGDTIVVTLTGSSVAGTGAIYVVQNQAADATYDAGADTVIALIGTSTAPANLVDVI